MTNTTSPVTGTKAPNFAARRALSILSVTVLAVLLLAVSGHTSGWVTGALYLVSGIAFTVTTLLIPLLVVPISAAPRVRYFTVTASALLVMTVAALAGLANVPNDAVFFTTLIVCLGNGVALVLLSVIDERGWR